MIEAETNRSASIHLRPNTRSSAIDLEALTKRFPHGFYSASKDLLNGTLDLEIAPTSDKRTMPPAERVLDALSSLREDGAIEATTEQIYKRARKLSGVKYWWQDPMGPASVYDALHFLTGNDQVLVRYHINYKLSKDSSHYTRDLLYRLAPKKTPQEPEV